MNVGRAMRRSAVAAGVAIALWVGASAARAGEEKPPMPVIEPARQVQITDDPGMSPSDVPATPDCSTIVTRNVIYVNVWELAAYYWPETITTLGAIAALIAFARVMRIRRLGRVPGEPYCRKCNYRLTALLSERCPECGTVITGKMRVIAKSAKWRVAAWLVILAVGASVWPVLWAAHPNRSPQIAQLWDWQSIGLAEWIKGHPSWPWYGTIKTGQQLVEIDLATGKDTRAFWPVRKFDRRVRISTGRSLLAYSKWKIDRWDLASGRHVASYDIPARTFPDWLSCSETLPEMIDDLATDGEYIYASAGGKILRWNAHTGTPCTAITLERGGGEMMASATGGHLVLISWALNVCHWPVISVDTGTAMIVKHLDFTYPVRFMPSADSAPFTYTVEDGVEGGWVVRVRNERLELVQELALYDPNSRADPDRWALLMSPSGRLAAMANLWGEAIIYDVTAQRPLARLSRLPWTVVDHQMHFSGDERSLCVTGLSPIRRQVVITATTYDLSDVLDARARRGGDGR